MATKHELPPWAGAPKLEFQIFKNATKMARSYHTLGVNLRRLLTLKSNEEGGTKYVRDLKISDSLGFQHEIIELPIKYSYFIIVILPPPDIEDATLLDREVELLFAADSMYHLGFLAKIVWYVFKDAILPGVREGCEAKYNIERLTFKGSYQEVGMDFEKLIVGFLGQLETYQVLVDHARASNRLLVQVMRRNLVTFSEAMRFPFLFKLNLTTFQLGNLCAVLDVPVKKSELYRNVSYHFNDWSNYSGKCRQGREKFAAECQRSDPEFSKYILSGIPTYDALLNFVGLLSNKNHKKSREDDYEKHMKHSSGNLEDRKKGGGVDDPPSDKDGDKERHKNKDTCSAWFFEAPVMPFYWINRASDISMEYAFYVVKQRWSYACVKQLTERFISAEAMENDFIPDVDCPSVGFLLVLTCFSKNLFLREPLKLADDGVESQSTVLYINDAIDAFLLIIGNPAQMDVHIFTPGNPNNDFTVRQLAELMTEETEYFVLKVDESPYIFGPIVKQRRSYSCVTRLIFCEWTEDLENDFEFTIVRPFNWTGPRMDFIPDTDRPSEGVTWVLACFSKNHLHRETWKLADGGNSQRTYVCIKEAIDAALLLMIVCPLCFNPDTDGPREGVPQVLAFFSKNLLRRETWKLADGGDSQRTYACIKEAIDAALLLMIAHVNVPGEQPLIAVSSKQLYGEGYNFRIAVVTIIIKQLVGHISTVGGPNIFTARELTEMMTYVPLIEASAEQFLGKGYDDSYDKRTPINYKQLGEPLQEDPVIEASTEEFLGKGYDDSDKRIPDVTLINKQGGTQTMPLPRICWRRH